MNEQNGILFSPKKKKKSCYNVDKPWGHYAKLNKPIIKGKTLYDSTHMKYLV